MFDQPRSQSNKVVKLSPDGTAGGPPPIVLTRLPVIIQSLRDKARQQLQNLLRELFDQVDDAMFELADKATSNQDQNIYFDSMREVRLGRKAMEASFFRSIDISFAQLLDHGAYHNEVNEPEREFSLDDLSLVKNDDLEEIVAIEAMINKANEQFAEPIQHLTLRIDHLVPVKVYQKNNPLGADVICHAFNDAAKHLAIDVKARLVLFKLFDHLLMAQLGSIFQALNQLLIDANILPSLKSGSLRVKRDIPSAAEYYGAGISADYPQGSPAGTAAAQRPGSSAHYDEQTNHVLHALRDLLSSHHAEAAGPAVRGFGQEVASHDLLRILSRAQQQNIAYNPMLYSASAPLNVRELLQNLLASSSPGKHQPQINPVDDDVINLVSMMFDFILDDRNLAAPMKALIGRLQIPMVKVAISDKSFFSKGGHPARRLLNEMAMAALGWQESSEENLRKDSLYNKMDAVVQTILADFDTDMEIFSQLLADFREFLEKDKRRAKILEQRTLDAEAGMAKSDRARAQVESVLQRITAGHELPVSAQKLLIGAWGNVLLIIALKQGTESEEWQGAIRTAQQLVWSLTAPMSKENRQGLLTLVPELLQKLRQGLDDIAYSSYEAAQLFKQLEILHLARLKSAPREVEASTAKTASAAQPQTISVSPQSDVPGTADTPVERARDYAESEGSQPAAVDTSLAALETIAISDEELDVATTSDEESLADGDMHLVMVSNITQGSWFEMQGEDGQKFRCRLAAIIRSSGKYIFVNRSGMKVAEESRMGFALALKNGRLQLLDDGMLFDRALEAVIGTLRAKR
ncbi:MAG TPA: DUF1631 domain-containing protein [Cellvibrio sp.]|nr:DUF1631 domain-containing protein [Cellvibrio sp.]